MSKFINLTKKCKAIAVAVSALLLFGGSSYAQEATEHIHAADAVLGETLTFNAKTGTTSFIVNTYDNTFEFELEANTRLLADSFSVDDNVAIYRGKLLGAKNSWARFTRINGQMEGAYFDGEELFLVKNYSELSHSLQNNALNQQESLYVETDAKSSIIINVKDIENSGTCALHDDIALNSGLDETQNAFDYDVYVGDLREMMDAQASKQIEINLYADLEFSGSSNDSIAEMISIVNVADGLFGEQIGVQLVVSQASNLSSNGTLTSTNPSTLVNALRLAGLPNPGVSHLFTNKNLDGSTVGIAYIGSLCRSSSVGITQRLGTKTPLIFAHELGHNFGAPHDNQSGSACSSEPSGFIMNPNISNVNLEFSSCSVTQIQPIVNAAMNGSRACITDAVNQAPNITSVATLLAEVGVAYRYDSDNTVNASGSGDLTFSLDIAPSGMSINDVGEIEWTPSSNNLGINTVQVRVSNQAGSDVQIFDISVEASQNEPSDSINFNEVSISSYGRNQDITGAAQVGDSPFELKLTGNTWKSIPLNYNVTSSTVIQFEFKSTSRGEIHGIAFDNDSNISESRSFNIFGSQSWGISSIRYSNFGETQLITIPVGDFFTGSFNRLAFIMDNDVNNPVSDSVFTNVVVFEEGDSNPSNPQILDLASLAISDFLPNTQDFNGTVDIIEQGTGIKIEGNKWQKAALNATNISPSTVVKFDFKTDSIGEIHGLAFYNTNAIDSSKTFQLTGTQNWGIRDFSYTGNGAWQSYTIPVGEFFTLSNTDLIFVMDDDGNSTGNSSFRNIQIID